MSWHIEETELSSVQGLVAEPDAILFEQRNEHRAASKQLPRNAPPCKGKTGVGGMEKQKFLATNYPPRREALRDLNLLGATAKQTGETRPGLA